MDFGLPEEEAEEEGGENRFAAAAAATETTRFLVWLQRTYIPPCPSLCWQRLAGRLAVPVLSTGAVSGSFLLLRLDLLGLWFWLAGGRAGGRWGIWSVGEKGKGIYFFFIIF